jgi:hypothetical protein
MIVCSKHQCREGNQLQVAEERKQNQSYACVWRGMGDVSSHSESRDFDSLPRFTCRISHDSFSFVGFI